MGSLIEKYNYVVKSAKALNDDLSKLEQELSNLSVDNSGAIEVRISKLNEQIERIDEYLEKVIAFQNLAARNLSSTNVSTIDAPEGYRVNLNRLRQWAIMIDPTSPDDPYAQRIYIVAKCDEHFLKMKRDEFSARILQLQEELKSGETELKDALTIKIANAREALKQYATSEDVYSFARAVVDANGEHWYKNSPEVFVNPNEYSKVIVPGAFASFFSFEEEQRNALKTMMGDCYDEKKGRVMLPVEIDATKEYILRIICSPSRRNELDKGIQNLIFQTIHENPAGSRKVFVFDPVRFKSSCLGTLRQFEDSFVMNRIPRNPEQLTAALEEFVSSFADTDDVIELYDSVNEYNQSVEKSKQIPLSTCVFYGWPNAYDNASQALIKRIIGSYERYGVSVITVDYSSESPKNDERNGIPEYAWQNSVAIKMFKDSTTINFSNGDSKKFKWYKLLGEITPAYVDSVKYYQSESSEIGNEYIKRYSLKKRPDYVRSYKKIELPFGIDGKDEAHSISFENENFATYLVGASRSGKSTLLHTLIAGLIRNYHPDNLELWLADFKQLEFKRYMTHLPPHVKYVLLDESTELVFDLIDKLTNEMLERQKLFARLGVQRIDQVDTTTLSKPLPVIFVILDEFSIMSQAISDSDTYKLKLQNILAKGAALGIKFLFASQTFTTGVRGLTSTARAQIQQRIAMKGSREEISETLELSTNLKTEQVNNWMDALPPHYALVKFREGADSLPLVKRFLVMYFKDYVPRDEMIDSINSKMHAVNGYNPGDINSYVNKNPVLVDGNTINVYADRDLNEYITSVKASDSADLSGDEMFVTLGTPRLMTNVKPIIVSKETRENILLIGRSSEQPCVASINMSAVKSWLSQGGKVQIWTYERNRLYRAYGDLFKEANVTVVEGIDNICDSIKSLKNDIINKKNSNTMIILFGMERICTDFDYISGGEPGKVAVPSTKPVINSAAVLDKDNKDQVAITDYATMWVSAKLKKKRELKAQGKSEDEIKLLLIDFKKEFDKEHEVPAATSSSASKAPAAPSTPAPAAVKTSTEKTGGAYNAKEDFVFVIKQGSRIGYHFVLNLNSVSDIKTCNLKPEFFRHKLSFQISKDDARTLYGTSKTSTDIPEHICQYDDTLNKFSFRPYLHKGICWEGWDIGEDGNAISPFSIDN